MDLINSPALYESPQIPEEQKDRLRVSTKRLAIGVDYDDIQFTYPSGNVEEIEYFQGTTSVLNIRLTYLTNAKKDLSRVQVI